jgi:hypothetical protein
MSNLCLLDLATMLYDSFYLRLVSLVRKGKDRYGYPHIRLGQYVGSLYLVYRYGRLGAQRFLVETTTFLNILFLVAVALLVVVSGGILYLTSLEWRNRRRQSQDKKMRR